MEITEKKKMRTISYNGNKVELTLVKTKGKPYVHYTNTYEFRVSLEGNCLIVEVKEKGKYKPFDKLLIDKYIEKSTVYSNVLNMLTENL